MVIFGKIWKVGFSRKIEKILKTVFSRNFLDITNFFQKLRIPWFEPNLDDLVIGTCHGNFLSMGRSFACNFNIRCYWILTCILKFCVFVNSSTRITSNSICSSESTIISSIALHRCMINHIDTWAWSYFTYSDLSCTNILIPSAIFGRNNLDLKFGLIYLDSYMIYGISITGPPWDYLPLRLFHNTRMAKNLQEAPW